MFKVVRIVHSYFFYILLHVIVIAYLQGCVKYDIESVSINQDYDVSPLSFCVISDLHFGNSVGEGPMHKVPLALRNITSQGSFDAMILLGDLTNAGRRDEYNQLIKVFEDKSNFIYPVDCFLFMMGNHDNYSISARYIYQKSLKPFNSGESYPLRTYSVIKGYPFITVSMLSSSNNDITDPSAGTEAYPDDTVDWLALRMERAQKECPGKPIFVFTHMPPRWTTYGTWSEYGNGEAWCMKVLNPVLNKYPQAVVFSGHTHYPIGDPRSIHQGANPDSKRQNYYTVINTSSTSYCEIPYGVVDDGVIPFGYDCVTEGLIVNELANGDIEIRRYDTYRNEEISPDSRWILKAPFDGSQFTYADLRDADDNPLGKVLYDGKPAPCFSEDSSIALETNSSYVTVTFPQAADNDCVFRYSVVVKDMELNEEVATASVFSLFYLNSDMPKTLSRTFDGLVQGKEYSIEVRAYDSYENASTPLCTVFRTAE